MGHSSKYTETVKLEKINKIRRKTAFEFYPQRII